MPCGLFHVANQIDVVNILLDFLRQLNALQSADRNGLYAVDELENLVRRKISEKL